MRMYGGQPGTMNGSSQLMPPSMGSRPQAAPQRPQSMQSLMSSLPTSTSPHGPAIDQSRAAMYGNTPPPGLDYMDAIGRQMSGMLSNLKAAGGPSSYAGMSPVGLNEYLRGLMPAWSGPSNQFQMPWAPRSIGSGQGPSMSPDFMNAMGSLRRPPGM